MTLAFDTLAHAEKLQAAGFTAEQARAQTEALAAIVTENLATKADIAALQHDVKELETGLKRDLKDLETTLRREITAMSDKLTIRLGGMLVVGIAVLAAVMKLL